MRDKSIRWFGLILVPVAFGTGCSDHSTQRSAPPPSPTAPTVARVVITPPTGSIKVGIPATFTLTVTNAAFPVTLLLDFGDGQTVQQEIGTGIMPASFSHTYRSAGHYTVAARLTDANSVTVAVSFSTFVS